MGPPWGWRSRVVRSIYAHLQPQCDLVAYSLIAVFAHHARPVVADAFYPEKVVATGCIVSLGRRGGSGNADHRYFRAGAGHRIDRREMGVPVKDQLGAMLLEDGAEVRGVPEAEAARAREFVMGRMMDHHRPEITRISQKFEQPCAAGDLLAPELARRDEGRGGDGARQPDKGDLSEAPDTGKRIVVERLARHVGSVGGQSDGKRPAYIGVVIARNCADRFRISQRGEPVGGAGGFFV